MDISLLYQNQGGWLIEQLLGRTKMRMREDDKEQRDISGATVPRFDTVMGKEGG